MFIDFHTHLWSHESLTTDLINYFKSRKIWDEQCTIMTSEKLLEIMDNNNIKSSVVLSTVLSPKTGNEEIDRMNRYVSSQISADRDRLLGFFTINPFFKKEALQVLERSINELRLCGLKIHPPFQEIFPNDEKLYPFYKKMEEYDLPVLFHTGSIGIIPYKDCYSNPAFLDDVACNFPNLTIIIGHSGKIWHKETAMLLRKHKNIYADISTNIGRDLSFSEHPMSWLLYKIKSYAGCMDRLLFGSDYPLYMQNETIKCFDKAVAFLNSKYPGFITGDDMEKIMYKNAEKLLNRIKNKRNL